MFDHSSFSRFEWSFNVKKGPIIGQDMIEDYKIKTGLTHLPSMVFGDSSLQIKNEKFEIIFDAFNALKCVRPFDPQSSVHVSQEWRNERVNSVNSIKVKECAHDWTFCTDFQGLLNSENQFLEAEEEIDYNLLARHDPIRYYEEIPLFDDELDDNGVSSFTLRIRVMDECFFVLARHFMRLDNVKVRVADTRIFHKFGEKKVLKEFSVRESDWDTACRLKCQSEGIFLPSTAAPCLSEQPSLEPIILTEKDVSLLPLTKKETSVLYW